MVKLALPTGSLEPKTLELFAAADWPVYKEPRKQSGTIADPIFSEIGFFHPRQIPELVADGSYDIGICGWDCVVESDAEQAVKIIAKLAYARATLGETHVVLFGAVADEVETPEEIPPGTPIVTEFPNCTGKFFNALRVEVQLRESRGSTEGLVPRRFRFGVCVSETGRSLVTNGLRVIAEILISSTVLIANTAAVGNESKGKNIQEIGAILCGTLEAQQNVEIKMNVSSESLSMVLEELPALKRPTVSPLADGEPKGSYFAISTVAPRSGINQLIRRLRGLGAEGIIQSKLDKVIR